MRVGAPERWCAPACVCMRMHSRACATISLAPALSPAPNSYIRHRSLNIGLYYKGSIYIGDPIYMIVYIYLGVLYIGALHVKALYDGPYVGHVYIQLFI